MAVSLALRRPSGPGGAFRAPASFLGDFGRPSQNVADRGAVPLPAAGRAHAARVERLGKRLVTGDAGSLQAFDDRPDIGRELVGAGAQCCAAELRRLARPRIAEFEALRLFPRQRLLGAGADKSALPSRRASSSPDAGLVWCPVERVVRPNEFSQSVNEDNQLVGNVTE